MDRRGIENVQRSIVTAQQITTQLFRDIRDCYSSVTRIVFPFNRNAAEVHPSEFLSRLSGREAICARMCGFDVVTVGLSQEDTYNHQLLHRVRCGDMVVMLSSLGLDHEEDLLRAWCVENNRYFLRIS